MIKCLKHFLTKKKFIILYVNKWFNILLEDLIQLFLLMGRQEVGKLIRCLGIYNKKKDKGLYRK